VITEVGPVDIDVPRDRDSRFEPATVKKRQRRLNGVDSMVISLTAKGLTTGEVQAHLAEVYGTDVSRETISKITDRVLDDLADWQNRPLDRVYPVVFIDAIVVKIRDGQVANRPVYTAIGVTVDGKRDILGLWVGTGGEGAKYWLQVLTEIKNRGVDDVCIVVCDGLKGLPESIEAVWPQAVVQTCVLHLIRNTFRLASRRDWDAMAKDLRPVYTAVNEADAQARLDEFHDKWGDRYPAARIVVGRPSRAIPLLVGRQGVETEPSLANRFGVLRPQHDRDEVAIDGELHRSPHPLVGQLEFHGHGVRLLLDLLQLTDPNRILNEVADLAHMGADRITSVRDAIEREVRSSVGED
jgi:hypothetical protein